LSKEKENIIELKDEDIKNVDKNVVKILDDFFGHTEKNIKRYDVLYQGPNYINISFYLNHSKNNNIDIVEDLVMEYFGFRTNRLIKKGEELTINYKKYE
jgi:SET domain-containing protein